MSDKHMADILVSGCAGILFGIIMTFAPNKITAIIIAVIAAIGMFVAAWAILRQGKP
jgi:uncharacterized membrane protein HdeD (DUF308 family)